MKWFIFSLTLATSFGAAGSAWAWDKVFEGHGEIETVKNCGTDWNVGDSFVLRYTPSGLTGNPDNSRVTLFSQRFAQAYTTSSGRFTSGKSNVNSMFIGEGFGPASTGPNDIPATVALTITSATDTSIFLTLTKATITQFGNTSGCIVTLRAGLALHKIAGGL